MTPLTNENDFESCLAESKQTSVFVFKHSTRCPISAGAHREVNAFLDNTGSEEATVYLVDVIEHRPVSNAIAGRLGIKHESPQLILLKDGRPVWNASHRAITQAAARDALAAHA